MTQSDRGNTAKAHRPAEPARGPSVQLLGRRMPLPANRMLRITVGVLLILGGLLAFLPILGLWMLPLGFLVLSVDFAPVRRWRRRTSVRYERWRRNRRLRKEAQEAAKRQSR